MVGDDVWVEARLKNGWFVRGRMVVQGGRAVVAELQIMPSGKAAPPGGVTQDVVRRVPLGSFGPYLMAANSFAMGDSGIGGLAQAFKRSVGARIALDRLDPRPRPRRASGREDLFYARLAAAYLKAIEQGSRSPIKDLASKRDELPSRIRDMVHEARERGLLSTGSAGRRGGELLPRALALLEKGERR